jgi:hypothetical protein
LPSYAYRCSKGHVTERTFATSGDKTRTTRCRCGRRAEFSIKDTFGGGHVQSIGDGIEHYHVGLGMPIRGNSHLRLVQKQRGCSDWEPDSKLRSRIESEVYR